MHKSMSQNITNYMCMNIYVFTYMCKCTVSTGWCLAFTNYSRLMSLDWVYIQNLNFIWAHPLTDEIQSSNIWISRCTRFLGRSFELCGLRLLTSKIVWNFGIKMYCVQWARDDAWHSRTIHVQKMYMYKYVSRTITNYVCLNMYIKLINVSMCEHGMMLGNHEQYKWHDTGFANSIGGGSVRAMSQTWTRGSIHELYT